MNLMQSFRMSMKAIMSNKARSFLTMLGIIIGVAAVVILVSLTQASNEKNMEWVRQMGTNTVSVYASSWGMPTLSSDLSNFINIDLADLTLGVTPNASTWGMKFLYGSKTLTDFPLYFGSKDFSLCQNYKIEMGRDLSYMDIRNSNRVVVLGSRIKEQVFNYKNPIGEYVKLGNEKFLVIGVYKERQDSSQWSLDDMVVVPYTQMRLLAPNNSLDQYTIKARDADSTGDIVTKTKAFLDTQEGLWWYDVSSLNEYAQEMENMNRGNTIMLASIAAISLIVGGIGIMNIMLVTVTERTREIGIRKAIGAERRSIITQFLIEASVLSFIGGLIGVLLGFLVTLFFGKITYDMIVLPWWPISLGALAFSVVLGIAFGLYPAAKASRLQPVEALRNE